MIKPCNRKTDDPDKAQGIFDPTIDGAEGHDKSDQTSNITESCIHYFWFTLGLLKDENWLCGCAFGLLLANILRMIF